MNGNFRAPGIPQGHLERRHIPKPQNQSGFGGLLCPSLLGMGLSLGFFQGLLSEAERDRLEHPSNTGVFRANERLPKTLISYANEWERHSEPPGKAGEGLTWEQS